MDKITNDIEKKKYTKRTILTGNSKRIEEVLKRFWGISSPSKNVVVEKEDIYTAAQKIFS